MGVMVYLTADGVYSVEEDLVYRIEAGWDELFRADDPLDLVARARRKDPAPDLPAPAAPVQSQEVWAAGVTYFRSRTARMNESELAGGGSFYDRVYSADRPELFFKATRSRVMGHGEDIVVREDSSWSVPEPELVLAVTSSGRVFGYTIGNDVSARDIEGENPLYLPQAKVYRGGCALGPGIYLSHEPLPAATEIRMIIRRNGSTAFEDLVPLSQMKRTAAELVRYLFRENVFPDGCYLFTGTGIVPPDDFSLRQGDEVAITIEPIGTLVNRVA